ncbi:MAG TPA: DUF202 domain-containing protein [Acidimicrobiales bacterium]|nr:DUF202 domain-containing protein [Acidimicrobiales bacterium]
MAGVGEGDVADGAGASDPGLAAERTDLAWNRSGLAVVVAVAIMLRRLWPLEGYKSVIALALIAAGATAWAVGMRLARRKRPDTRASGMLGVSTCRMLTVGTVILAAAGLLIGVFAPG